MPKVTRKSAAAAARAQQNPSRNARPVFGDVSNNSKGQQNASAATKAKKTTRTSSTNPTTRRRSSRLSAVGQDETEAITISTAAAILPSNIQPSKSAAAKSNSTTQAPAIATAVATRRTRASRKTIQEEEQASNQPALSSVVEVSESSLETTGESTQGSATGEEPPTARTTRSSKGKQNSVIMAASKPSSRPTRSANKRRSTTELEVDAHQVDHATLVEDKKPPALKTRASRARGKQEEAEAAPANEPATRTRARKGQEEVDALNQVPEVAPAKRTRASSKGWAGQVQSSSTARGHAATEKEEDVIVPDATTRVASARGRSKLQDAPKETAAKPAPRGRSMGKAAAATKPIPKDTADAPRRSGRSTSRAAPANVKGLVATGKSSGSGKTAASKRGRQNEEPEQPRKSARHSRSKSTKRFVVRPKVCYPCPDFLPQDDFRLFRGEARFDASKFTRGIAPVDLPNKGKIEEVTEYVTDIMQRLFERELHTRPHPYMNEQPTLNTNMRSILIDWLVEVHMKFRLESSTLYLCVNIIDRFLERCPTERSRLQLVGVTSLLVACKIEEIYPPEVRDCVYICDRAYSREEVLDMEVTILRILKYSVTAPTGHPFLVRFLHITKATKLQKHAANYYMERMLQEYTCLKHRPSLVAASCVTLALNNASIRSYEGRQYQAAPGVPKELLEYTGFDKQKILEVADKVSTKVQNTQVTNSKRELIAVKRKYEAGRFQCVSSEFDDPDVHDIILAACLS